MDTGRLAKLAAVAAVAVAVLANAWTQPVDPVDYDNPLSDERHYVGAAQSLIGGDGYRLRDGSEPRYPPGTTLAVVPFSAADAEPWFPRTVSLLLVTSIAALGWRIGGWLAASFAVAILYNSQLVEHAATQFMSDGLAATLTVAAALLAGRPALLGVFAGLTVVVRIACMPNLVAAAFVHRRGSLIVAAAVPLVLLVVWSWGYNTGESGFAFSYLTESAWKSWLSVDVPNPAAYVLVLFAGVNGWAPPLLLAAGVWGLVRTGGDEARFAALVSLGTFALYSVYMYQSARFMAPVIALLAAHTGSVLAMAVQSAWKWSATRAADIGV